MSCCPPAPPIKVSDAPGLPNAGQESDIQPGESVECYAARAGNQTGKLDDATDNALNKIENTSIPIDTSAHVNVTFKMTVGSTRTPSAWSMTSNGGSVWSNPTVTFTSNGVTATFSGTFAAADRDKAFEVLVTASDQTGQIDARTFKFSPTVSSNTDSIKFILPLPGSIVRSPFGPRVHPNTHHADDGVMKLHTGIDLVLPNHGTTDVLAAADGEVVFSGVNATLTSGYGNCIKIAHRTGSGKLLCTTVYGHMAQRYVTEGTKVSAGQKIGKEGTTGSSTGNHLHFECRLPNNTPVDPTPYITGTLTVATSQNADASPATTETKTGTSAVTESEVNARSTACPAPGIDPQTGMQTPPPQNAPSPVFGDAFEYAWYFTMTAEIGSWFMTQPQFSPGDPELDAGLHETQPQRHKVGYQPGPNFPGGETKFGIAQNPNGKTVVVDTISYLQAKSFGRNGYWEISGSTKCSNKAGLIGIMLFDMNFLHGPGNARAMLAGSPLAQATTPSSSRADQLAAADQLHSASMNFISGLRQDMQKGWRNRANARIAYVKSLPDPLTSPA